MERRTKTASIRVGIDTGGTFTDFVVWRDGRLSNRKVLSTPQDPSLAIFEGVGDILKDTPAVFIVHGTTVATNALLQRKGGRIALITTAGFEDVLAIGRQTRRNLYALQPESRFELIPAERRFGLHERTLGLGRHREARPGDRGPAGHPEDQELGRRGRRRLSPPLLRQPGERRGRGPGAREGGPALHRLEPAPARAPRVRADGDDGRQRLPHARHGPLPRRARSPHRTGGAADHAVERRLHLAGPGPGRADPDRTFRAGRGGRRSPDPRPGGRLPRHRQLRHGRDLDRCLSHRGGHPPDPREPGRGIPHPAARHRHPLGRRRRRIDRLTRTGAALSASGLRAPARTPDRPATARETSRP